MIRVIHVSDLHFHTKSDDNKKIEALLVAIKDKYFKGEPAGTYLMVTGDIVDDGEVDQYRNAIDALKQFPEKSLLLTPGNHDYGALGNFYDDDCAEYFDDTFLKSLKISHDYKGKKPKVDMLSDDSSKKLLAIGLNSALQTKTWLDFAKGNIGDDQLGELEQILADPKNRDIPKMVYHHHRPLLSSCVSDEFMKMNDGYELMAICHNRVDVIAFGHTGGSEKGNEHSNAHLMNVQKCEYGVRYLSNANSCVDGKRCNVVEIENGFVHVKSVKL